MCRFSKQVLEQMVKCSIYNLNWSYTLEIEMNRDIDCIVHTCTDFSVI